MRYNGRQKQLGISMLEIVLAIILIGTFGTIAVVKLSNSSSSMVVAQEASQIAAALRHAQFMALNWGCNLRVTATGTNFQVTSNSAYTGKPCASVGAAIVDPANRQQNSTFTIVLSPGLAFQASYQIDYDSYGRPNNGGTLTTNAYTMSISASGVVWHVAIAPITGFITVTKT